MPSSSTPANATIATVNSKRLTRHSRAISRKSIRPFTATSTMAASTALGRFWTRPVRKSRQRPSVAEANTSASGVLRAGLLVHRRLRQAAGDRVAAAERDQQVGDAEAEQLLPHVERVAVLHREGARRRHALDVGEQQAGERERDQAVHVARPQLRQPEAGQPARHAAHQRQTGLTRAA